MVSVITCTFRDHCMANIFQNYEQQKVEEKELIIVLNKDEMNKEKWEEEAKKYEDVIIYQLSEATSLGECLNFALQKAKYDIIAKFDDDDYYGPDYLTESLTILATTNAQVVGKRSIYIYFTSRNLLGIYMPNCENRFINHQVSIKNRVVAGSTLVFNKSIFPHIQFPHLNLGEDTGFVHSCLNRNIPIYSGSRSNYVYFRNEQPKYHTSDASNKRLLSRCKIVYRNKDFRTILDHGLI
ncbi:glycosyltransferase [Pseudalkalibacillus sp. SCS-8]|uniref:glycosyltransferase n=1 Tax=Pseudalkalibacillus nanhaiensis TaxID=3115291 RepID=UPI0032DA7E6B